VPDSWKNHPESKPFSMSDIVWSSSVIMPTNEVFLHTNPLPSRSSTEWDRHQHPNGLMFVEDVMEYLGAGRTTVYNLLGSGQIKSFKVGRRRLVRPQDLQEFVDHFVRP
jgi:excisionase family DNA binding protein